MQIFILLWKVTQWKVSVRSRLMIFSSPGDESDYVLWWRVEVALFMIPNLKIYNAYSEGLETHSPLWRDNRLRLRI